MLYCIEVKRGGIGEEDMVIHQEFSSSPSRQEALTFLYIEDIGYDDKYCKFEYYQVN